MDNVPRRDKRAPVIEETEQGFKVEQKPVTETLIVIKDTEDGLALTWKKARLRLQRGTGALRGC
ncbi:MAG: hypothetical protein M1830_007035 [Pleopsidium flavum]|nr:MAG: hypothetical protein M1830_007035 [Pleopsidium flavum]